MGGAIILIALFGQNNILEQQHNMSRSCDLVSLSFYILQFKMSQRKLYLAEKYMTVRKGLKTTWNNIIETSVSYFGHFPTDIFTTLKNGGAMNWAWGCSLLIHIEFAVLGQLLQKSFSQA